MRTLGSWQRTGISCIVYAVVLARFFALADVAVGLIFVFLAAGYNIASFIQTQRQLSLYLTHEAYLVNNRMVLFSSGITLIAYFFLLYYF